MAGRSFRDGSGSAWGGATPLYKVNSSATARMIGRLVLNGVTEIGHPRQQRIDNYQVHAAATPRAGPGGTVAGRFGAII